MDKAIARGKDKKLFVMTFRAWFLKKKMVMLVMSILQDQNFRVDWANSLPLLEKQPSMEASRIVVV